MSTVPPQRDRPPPGTTGRPVESIEVPHGAVAWLYARTVATTLAGSLFYLYLARVASLEILGAAAVLQAFATILSTSMSLGLGQGFTHFLAYHRARGEAAMARSLIRTSYLTAALLSLAAVGVAVAISGELSVLLFHSSAYGPSVAMVGALAGLQTAILLLTGVLLGLQRYIPVSTVAILGNTAMFAFPIALFTVWGTLQSIVIGWILGVLVWVVAAIVAIERVTGATELFRARIGVLSAPSNRNLFAYSIPLVAALLITTSTYYIDRLVLSSIANLTTVGVYNYAILFATAAFFVANPFASILNTRFSALFGRSEWTHIRTTFRNSSTLIVLAFVPLALGAAALGPVLLRYVVGRAFVAAAIPLAALLGISAVFITANVLFSLATGIRRTTTLLAASSCALVGNASLSILLVPHLGMLGAAIGNSAMFWAPFFVLRYSLRNTGLVEYDLRAILAIWVAAGAMAVLIGVPLLLLHYTPIYVPVFVALGVAVFLVLLRLLRALPAETTDELNRQLPRWGSWLRPLICWVAVCAERPRVDRFRELSSPAKVERR